MSVFGQKEAMELFQSLGIYTKDKNGYVYPYSEQAASVREAFETEILSNPSITFVPFSEVSLSESPYHNRGICGTEVWL